MLMFALGLAACCEVHLIHRRWFGFGWAHDDFAMIEQKITGSGDDVLLLEHVSHNVMILIGWNCIWCDHLEGFFPYRGSEVHQATTFPPSITTNQCTLRNPMPLDDDGQLLVAVSFRFFPISRSCTLSTMMLIMLGRTATFESVNSFFGSCTKSD